MTQAVELQGEFDRTDVPHIVRRSIQLGILESILVVVLSLITRFTGGALESVLLAVALVIGFGIVVGLPGIWTRARTIEGIAGAAGIGLGAAFVYLLVDVALLQPLGVYTNRWREIGGFSNWWYHPVWWMAGTFLPWMGAWVLANEAAKDGRPSIVRMMITGIACTIVLGIIAVLIHFPGARWNVPTFGIAFLPGIVVAVVVSGVGLRRG
jgi:hypothetical protein